MNFDLVVVIPIYNEEKAIKTVLTDWQITLQREHISAQFLAINDGSTDASETILNSLTASIPNLQPVHKTNLGHGHACRTGYERAIQSHTPWVLQIDSDGQCLPEYFADFWKQREENDCVFGTRKQRHDGFERWVITKLSNLMIGLIAQIRPMDTNVPYRLIRREVLAEALKAIPQDFDMFNVALSVTLRRNLKLRWHFIPIHFPRRAAGNSHLNLLKILKLGGRMLWDLQRAKA